MTGLLRDSRTVEVDDRTLTELHRHGGKCLVYDSHGAVTAGELVHDGQIFVIRLDATIDRDARRRVKIKPRLVLAQGAQQ